MYTLILTKEERAAFDWVGGRYSNGDDMSSILLECLPPESEWDDANDIEFHIPEHKAWAIHDLADDDDQLWPCFAHSLAMKMQAFIDQIV